MRRILLLASLVAACGFTEPGRPDGPHHAWNTVDTLQPGSWHGAKLTWDPRRGVVVMYGGRHASKDATMDAQDGKVYAWDRAARTWNPICAGGPAPRYLPGFAFNPNTGNLTLVGGSLDGAKFGDLSNEVWTCDNTDTWTRETPTLNIARAGADLVFDGDTRELMLVGGRSNASQLHSIETSMDGVTWVNHDNAISFDCAGAGQNVTYDSDSRRMLAFAGELSAGSLDANVFHDEIWQLFSGHSEWTQLCEKCSGVPRSDASIVHLGGEGHEHAENYVINGYIGGDDETNGTWLVDHDTLLPIIPGEPLKRDGFGVAWDGVADTLIGFGGAGLSCPFDFECDQTLELEHAP